MLTTGSSWMSDKKSSMNFSLRSSRMVPQLSYGGIEEGIKEGMK